MKDFLTVERTRVLHARLDAAIAKLLAHGWSNGDIDRALSGLLLEDTVEEAERHASQINPAFKRVNRGTK